MAPKDQAWQGDCNLPLLDEALDALQARAAEWLKGSGSLADALLADRRAEVATENLEE